MHQPSTRSRVYGRRRWTTAGLAVAATALVGVLVLQPTSASAPSIGRVLRGDVAAFLRDGDVDEADGELPDGVGAFDDGYPGIARLDPELLSALRAAAADAATAGIELQVNSGWRSPEHQEQVLQDAVAEHGSEEEAARWAATPETSPHVSGDAVDVGPEAARAWLAEHGPQYGLCRVYDNEPWHFELGPVGACPPTYPDPTWDPRMG